MGIVTTFANRRRTIRVVAGVLAFISPGIVRAQSSASAPVTATDIRPAATHAESDEYRVGPGDVLSISVTEAPEMGGKFRITETGALEMGVLPAPIAAEGKTPVEISRAVR